MKLFTLLFGLSLFVFPSWGLLVLQLSLILIIGVVLSMCFWFLVSMVRLAFLVFLLVNDMFEDFLEFVIGFIKTEKICEIA